MQTFLGILVGILVGYSVSATAVPSVQDVLKDLETKAATTLRQCPATIASVTTVVMPAELTPWMIRLRAQVAEDVPSIAEDTPGNLSTKQAREKNRALIEGFYISLGSTYEEAREDSFNHGLDFLLEVLNAIGSHLERLERERLVAWLFQGISFDEFDWYELNHCYWVFRWVADGNKALERMKSEELPVGTSHSESPDLRPLFPRWGG